MRKNKLIVLAAVALIVGCQESDADIANGDDPLRALTVPHRSERFTTSYWTQKSVSDAELWTQAVEYCADKTEGDHPNCDAVRYVENIDRRSRLPEDRPDTFRLTVPQAARRDTTSR
jgi:hypothetical protein